MISTANVFKNYLDKQAPVKTPTPLVKTQPTTNLFNFVTGSTTQADSTGGFKFNIYESALASAANVKPTPTPIPAKSITKADADAKAAADAKIAQETAMKAALNAARIADAKATK